MVLGAFYTGLNGYIQGLYSDLLFSLILSSSFKLTPFNDLGTYLGSYYFEFNSPTSIFSGYFIVGSIIFFLGMAINIHCDSILRRLAASKKPGDKKGYKIPYGGAFNFVTGMAFFINFELMVFSYLFVYIVAHLFIFIY